MHRKYRYGVMGRVGAAAYLACQPRKLHSVQRAAAWLDCALDLDERPASVAVRRTQHYRRARKLGWRAFIPHAISRLLAQRNGASTACRSLTQASSQSKAEHGFASLSHFYKPP